MYPKQFNDLLKEENKEQPQTLFLMVVRSLVAKMIGSHLDKVNTKYCKGKIETFNPTHEYVGDFIQVQFKTKRLDQE